MGELALEAGVPAGVFNVVPGSGEVAGAALAKHKGIDKASFAHSLLPPFGDNYAHHKQQQDCDMQAGL